ncbi:MAG: Fic family protein [Flavobacteriales bacterium]|nr:Fic family protein [Flavobacteriales bacterium]
MYIHERKGWPDFKWDAAALTPAVAKARQMQGRLLGRMVAVGFDLRDEASLETLTLDVVRSSAIEGEVLDAEQVRSSLARHLGLDISGAPKADRHVEGIVEMMLDATQRADEKLTAERLFGWHAALFPTGRSGMHRILVGRYRDDSTGPMQVVSGAMGKERVHYEAAAGKLRKEMSAFLKWLNTGSAPGPAGAKTLDPLLKAGIAHFWFVTLHPFEDGNGRMARAIADLLLTRADGSPQRFYSMSAQIRTERKKYYDILESSQRGALDITPWLTWFIACLQRAIASAEHTLAAVLAKHDFWQTHAKTILNARQVKVLNKLLDGFEGHLTSSKYAKLTKTSQDTAARDIADLMTKKVLKKSGAGGRSTHYVLVRP